MSFQNLGQVVNHYVLSSHPRNRAIVDVRDKRTGQLSYIKIRHKLENFYAISLVDPETFEVWAETQVKSTAARQKPVMLHSKQKVDFKEAARIGFKWAFEWEGEKYCWVRESRISQSLECRATRPTGGDICVAQYLPRSLKNEYFGILSVLEYNFDRCELRDTRSLELLLVITLLMLLDKDDGSWKRDELAPVEQPIVKSSNTKRRDKVERENELRLKSMLEKDVRRSQKQISRASNSPTVSPADSPVPSPSVSTERTSSLKDLARLFGQLKLSNHSDATMTLPSLQPSRITDGQDNDEDDDDDYLSFAAHNRHTFQSRPQAPPPLSIRSIQWQTEEPLTNVQKNSKHQSLSPAPPTRPQHNPLISNHRLPQRHRSVGHPPALRHSVAQQ